MWMLDTDVCVAYLNGTGPSIRERLLALPPSDVLLAAS
jgi:hypothetical protein